VLSAEEEMGVWDSANEAPGRKSRGFQMFCKVRLHWPPRNNALADDYEQIGEPRSMARLVPMEEYNTKVKLRALKDTSRFFENRRVSNEDAAGEPQTTADDEEEGWCMVEIDVVDLSDWEKVSKSERLDAEKACGEKGHGLH
jgi:hypothetical protein